MKTVNGKTKGSSYFALAASALLALAMMGCGNNGGNNNNVPSNGNVVGYGNCVTCAAAGTLATVATASNQYLGEFLQLQFLSNNPQPYSTGFGQQFGFNSYQASVVTATGTLQVSQNWIASCGVAAGTYQLQPFNQPGQWQGSMIQNLTLVGTGPTTIEVTLNRVYFYSPSQMQVNGFMRGQALQQNNGFANGGICQITYN